MRSRVQHGGRELGVHVRRCCSVGETVAGAVGHSFQDQLDPRKEHDVVHGHQPRRLQEGGQVPGSEHAVVDRGQTTVHESTGGGGSHGGDHPVLFAGFGQPGIDGASSEVSEEVITPHQRAAVHPLDQQHAATVDFPAPGGPVTISSSAMRPVSTTISRTPP